MWVGADCVGPLQIDELMKACEAGTAQYKVYEQLYDDWQMERKARFQPHKKKGDVSRVPGLNRFQAANDVRNHQEDTNLCLSKVEFGELLDKIFRFYESASAFGIWMRNSKTSQTCGLDLYAVYLLLFSTECNVYVSSLDNKMRQKLDQHLNGVQQGAQNARVDPWSADFQKADPKWRADQKQKQAQKREEKATLKAARPTKRRKKALLGK